VVFARHVFPLFSDGVAEDIVHLYMNAVVVLEPDEIRHTVDEYVQICGGEPFVRPELYLTANVPYPFLQIVFADGPGE